MNNLALMVCCYFENVPTHRGYVAYEYFKHKFETKNVYSAFSHIHKKYVTYDNNDYTSIKARPYQKNLSFSRILSYIDFSLQVKKMIKTMDPTFIYVQLPPNMVAYFVIKEAKKRNIPVILDILDLWPESLPLPGKIKKILNITVGILWKYLRTYSIKNASYIISESQYFFDRIALCKQYINTQVLSLSKYSNIKVHDLNSTSHDKIIISFLGSMNSISDFRSLLEITDKIKNSGKSVMIYLIGDGVNRDWLLNELENRDIKFHYFGKIFDESKKEEILGRSWFGFNGYKTSTEVALSYKSVDYLSFSLPLINNTKGDTRELVEKYSIGFNYNCSNLDEIASKIGEMSFDDIYEMKNRAAQVFNDFFSFEVFQNKMDKVLNKIGITGEENENNQ
jgi:glycosyltransferase involved in cell wall biosynthesis